MKFAIAGPTTRTDSPSDFKTHIFVRSRFRADEQLLRMGYSDRPPFWKDRCINLISLGNLIWLRLRLRDRVCREQPDGNDQRENQPQHTDHRETLKETTRTNICEDALAAKSVAGPAALER